MTKLLKKHRRINDTNYALQYDIFFKQNINKLNLDVFFYS